MNNKRYTKRKGLIPISSFLEDVLRKRGILKRLKEEQAFALWCEVVGEKMAKHAYPENIRGGTLFVICENPVWMQELSFHREKIIKELNKRVGEELISSLHFKAGKKEENRRKRLQKL